METIFLQTGHLLATSHEIIKKIFSNLGYYDLVSSLEVCQSWNSVGKAILLKERKLQYITIHPNNVPTTDNWFFLKHAPNQNEVLQNFLEKLTSKSVYLIGFTSDGWLFRKDIITKYFPNGNSLSNTIKKALHNDIELVLIEASGIIGSVEKKLSSNKTFQDSVSLSASIKNVLSKEEESGGKEKCLELSKNHDASCTSSDSENETQENSSEESLNNVGYSIELEESFNGGENSEALSFIVFPKQPGVKIKIISLNEKDFYKTYRPDTVEKQKYMKITEDEFNSVCGLTPNENLKACLIFAHTLRSFTRSFLEAAQNRENDNIAIGGGLIDWMQQKEDTFKGTLGIVISGDNVRTASVVVSSNVKNELDVILCLMKLKEDNLPEDHSVCFMFTCCGRGSHWYMRNTPSEVAMNIETKAFRKLFPKTPVFGFFGDGEIGNNFYMSYDDSSSSKKKKKKRQNLFHHYSTTFVLVSFM